MFHTGTYVYSDLLAVGEVARRYPEHSIIAGFGGFADMWFEVPILFAELNNLHLDSSLLFSQNIMGVISEIGISRVIFGSGEPRNNYAVHFNALGRYDIAEDMKSALMGANAKRIYKI